MAGVIRTALVDELAALLGDLPLALLPLPHAAGQAVPGVLALLLACGRADAGGELVDELVEGLGLLGDASCVVLRVEAAAASGLGNSGGGHEGAVDPAVDSGDGEGGDGQRLDARVEGLVEVAELLVVGQVAGPGPVAQGDDEAGTVRIPAHAGGGLDVLGGVLGLADDEHEAEAGDVHAHLEHGGGQDDVVGFRRGLGGGRVDARVEGERHPVQGGSDVGGGDARGELSQVQSTESRTAATRQAGVTAGLGQAGLDVVLDVAGHAGQLPGGGEVSDERHVGVGGGPEPVEEELGSGHDGLGGLDLGGGQAYPGGGQAHVEAPGVGVVDLDGAGEEGVGGVEDLGRKDGDVAAVETTDLVGDVADGG